MPPIHINVTNQHDEAPHARQAHRRAWQRRHVKMRDWKGPWIVLPSSDQTIRDATLERRKILRLLSLCSLHISRLPRDLSLVHSRKIAKPRTVSTSISAASPSLPAPITGLLCCRPAQSIISEYYQVLVVPFAFALVKARLRDHNVQRLETACKILSHQRLPNPFTPQQFSSQFPNLVP